MLRQVLRLLGIFAVAASAAACSTSRVNNGLGLEDQIFAQLRGHLASRDSVRLRGSFGDTVVSRPVLTSDSVVSDGLRFRLQDLHSIQIRGGSSGTGAAVGAGIGFVGGLLTAVAVTSSLCSDGLGCSNQGGGTAVLAAGSMIGGALLGALIGAPIRKWHTVYRARSP